jgi:hypothetical protein
MALICAYHPPHCLQPIHHLRPCKHDRPTPHPGPGAASTTMACPCHPWPQQHLAATSVPHQQLTPQPKPRKRRQRPTTEQLWRSDNCQWWRNKGQGQEEERNSSKMNQDSQVSSTPPSHCLLTHPSPCRKTMAAQACKDAVAATPSHLMR